jgi:hypothetical protein
MIRRLSILASVAAVALLAASPSAEAALRNVRNKIPPAPKGTKLPPEVLKVVESQFPKAKVTGFFLEEKGELEVLVAPPGTGPIEVVFLRKGSVGPWRLAGYEFPVPAVSLAPRAVAALRAKYPKGKIGEVEMVFNAQWAFVGYQVTVRDGNAAHEEFVLASGAFIKDPL